MTYYVGKLTVGAKPGVNVQTADYYTMSDFSSWGIPGSLELKPEITAPGGNIYSCRMAAATRICPVPPWPLPRLPVWPLWWPSTSAPTS